MSKNSLDGKFFHSIKDGKIHWQGVVVSSPKDGWYLVQLFEWMMGEESCCYLVEIEAMRDWIFYKNAESMQHSYHDGVAYHVGKNNA